MMPPIFRPFTSILDPLPVTRYFSTTQHNGASPDPRPSLDVLTLLRHDFPGFTYAIEFHSLAIAELYLVVGVSVDDTPYCIHNV